MKLVFAAGVEDEHRRGLHDVEAELAERRDVPKTYWASCESTVGLPETYGTAWVTWARSETPSTSEPRIVDMMTSTRRALRPSGGRKFATPFEIASRPVSEEPPLANALRMMNSDAP